MLAPLVVAGYTSIAFGLASGCPRTEKRGRPALATSQKGATPMASLRRVYYTRPIPLTAERVTHKNKPAVRFLGDDGKSIVAPITRNGKRCRVPSSKWYGQYTDSSGVVRRVPLSENKTAAQQMLHELVRQTEMEKVGITDPFRAHRIRPLDEQLDAYRQFHADKGNTGRQTSQAVRRCEKVFEGCGFARLADLEEEAALRWLKQQHSRPRSEGGIGPQTFNHYVTALKAFGNWLVRSRRAQDNAFRHMGKLNVEVDIRHERRPLSPDEYSRVLDAAQCGDIYRKLAGPDRRMLYLVGGVTGLRATELASLTPESFTLDAETPVVVVEAAYSKHRRRDEVPLHPDLVSELRGWLAGKTPGERDWPGKWAQHNEGCDMMRRDLETARAAWVEEAGSNPCERGQRERSDFLTYRDSAGRVADFHSLRHTFITDLVKAGVAPKDAKELARHSTITLTMDRYSHVTVRDTAAAVARLDFPGNPKPDREILQATGTDGSPLTPSLALPYPKLALAADSRGGESGVGEEITPEPKVDVTCLPGGVLETNEDDRGREKRVHPAGVEPATFGSVVLCPGTRPICSNLLKIAVSACPFTGCHLSRRGVSLPQFTDFNPLFPEFWGDSGAVSIQFQTIVRLLSYLESLRPSVQVTEGRSHPVTGPVTARVKLLPTPSHISSGLQ